MRVCYHLSLIFLGRIFWTCVFIIFLTIPGIMISVTVLFSILLYPELIKRTLNREIEMIAPSHGYILRENAASFIGLYDDMSKDSGNNKTRKVAAVYTPRKQYFF